MIGCLRTLGLAARYVSGYLLTVPPPGGRGWSAPTPRTPGCRCGCRTPAGSISTRPTTVWSTTSTSRSGGGATSAMSPRCAAILGGGEQELAVHVTVTPRSEAPIESQLHG